METKWKVGMKVCCRVRQRITYRSKIKTVSKTMIVTEDGQKWLARSGEAWGSSSSIWNRSPSLEAWTKEKEQASLLPTAINKAAEKLDELQKIKVSSAKDFEAYLPKLEEVKIHVIEVLRLAAEEEKAISKSEPGNADKKALQAECERCGYGKMECVCPLNLR